MVKQEESMAPMEKQYPLAGLENSYPVIDYMSWHNWLMQKQKNIEFQIKSKEEQMNQTQTYNYQDGAYFNKPQDGFYFNKQ